MERHDYPQRGITASYEREPGYIYDEEGARGQNEGDQTTSMREDLFFDLLCKGYHPRGTTLPLKGIGYNSRRRVGVTFDGATFCVVMSLGKVCWATIWSVK